MSYATIDDVRARLPLVTEGVRSDEQLADLLAQADALVDGYLRGAYVLPLASPVDPLVHFLALELACALTLENVYGEETPNVGGEAAASRARVTAILEAVAAGTVLLEHEKLYEPPGPATRREPLERGAAEGSAFALGPHILNGSETE